MFGYAGKILRVDLSRKEIEYEDLNEEIAQKYIGGTGLAAKIVWDETTEKTEAFSPENPLTFMVGPCTGTAIPSTSRYTVAAVSPLTGIWGEAHGGGTWGHALKASGFDGIIIKGASEEPVYLWVNDGSARIVEAGYLWGKDTFDSHDLLRKETDQKASVVTIGPAGEKLVKFAAIMGEGRAGRAAARCGLGAVMGSKRLKAIVIKGTRQGAIHDEGKLRESVKKNFQDHLASFAVLRERFANTAEHFYAKGKIPVKNFGGGNYSGLRERCIEAIARDGDPRNQYFCGGCTVSCVESQMDGDRRHMVIPALLQLGPGCLIDDWEAVQEAFDLSQRYGMDVCSLAGVISFAMELREKGLLTHTKMDGVDLKWGNGEGMIEMVKKIGERDGFGKLLGEGVKRVAQNIGGLAQEYALNVKGMEFPFDDPRGCNSFALEYATCNRGADHMEGFTALIPLIKHIASYIPGYRPEEISALLAVKGVGKLTAWAQNFMNMMDSMVVCKFIVGGSGPTCRGPNVAPEIFVEWLNCVTGWEMTLQDFLQAGERIFNLKRMFNVRRGISRKDDTIPPRFLTHPRGDDSEATDNLPPLGMMLNEFYSHRGWSEEGIPTKAKLLELGLNDLVSHSI